MLELFSLEKTFYMKLNPFHGAIPTIDSYHEIETVLYRDSDFEPAAMGLEKVVFFVIFIILGYVIKDSLHLISPSSIF